MSGTSVFDILQGGIYFFKIIDFYSSAISLMLVAFFEVIAVTWFYGTYQHENNENHRPFWFP